MLRIRPKLVTFFLRPRQSFSSFCQHRNPVQSQLLHIRQLLRKNSANINSYTLLRALKPRPTPTTATHRHHIYHHATAVHSLIVRLGFHSVVFLQTALISLYSSSSHVTDAHRLFDEIPSPTLVAWTGLISAYAANNHPAAALDVFRKMQLQEIQPDRIALTVALSACAHLGALHFGQWIHANYIRGSKNPDPDLKLTNALIDMYCKCGDISAARQLFETTSHRDTTTWTSVIVGFALHGRAHEALALFEDMEGTSSCTPNEVTFVGVLTACRHAGLVERGRREWERMTRRYGLSPGTAHYGCMVDLLCRSGRLEEAYELAEKSPENAVLWRNLLGACALEGNGRIGDVARVRLMEMEHASVDDGVGISNAYARLGMWGEKEGVRRCRKGRRDPGCSLVQVGDNVREFVAGDRRATEIRQVIQRLMSIVRAGY